jgi:hypothetical protein
MSAGVGAVLLDDCMQVAMNAPPDGADSEWCDEVVVEYCAAAARALDSPSYNDMPNQAPVEHRTGERAMGKETAKEIICGASSFHTKKAAAASLPMPTTNENNDEVATTSIFMNAIMLGSQVRAEDKRLLIVKKQELADKIDQADKEKKAALLQQEDDRIGALAPKERKLEEEASRNVKAGAIAKNNVVASIKAQNGVGRVALMAPAPAVDSVVDALSMNRRRSGRAPQVTHMDADYVERQNRAAIKESAKNAKEKKVASESGRADITKKRGRPTVSGKVGNKKAKKNERTSNKRKTSESRSKNSQKSKKNKQ